MDKHCLMLDETILEIIQMENYETVFGSACRTFMRYWGHKSSVDHIGKIGNCCVFKFEFENNEFTLLEVINHNFDELK